LFPLVVGDEGWRLLASHVQVDAVSLHQDVVPVPLRSTWSLAVIVETKVVRGVLSVLSRLSHDRAAGKTHVALLDPVSHRLLLALDKECAGVPAVTSLLKQLAGLLLV